MARRYQYERITARQLSSAFNSLGIESVDQFCRLSGVGERTVRRWLEGAEDIPHYVVVLVTLLDMPGAMQKACAVTEARIQDPGVTACKYQHERLTRRQFSQALRDLNLTMRKFSRLSGAGERSVDRWLRGECDIPHYVTLFCTLLRMPGAMEKARAVTELLVIRESDEEPKKAA
ncbi:hypothetical protein [Microvirga massiliensis]|uniref:hypothetical protein n=1 Tax=Microvirga massiliensis TaxID=1033741 RepID=UPI00065FBFC9|nr:hypothetical protein [Microvirga massiliensis]